jgi:hypothetical protein
MTVHLCRDYQSVSQSSQTDSGYGDMSAFAGMYVMAAFMRRVLGYSIVGQTNFDIDGTFTIAGSASNLATINADGSVSIPSAGGGSHTVGVGDVNRMLVLKSAANPTVNSGCFLITGVGGGFPNSYVVSSRIGSSGLLTPEVGLQWWLMENDSLVTGDQTPYGLGSIIGYGNSRYGANTGQHTTIPSNVTLPTGTFTLVVNSTTGFPSAGRINVAGVANYINYTGTSPGSFTGCAFNYGGAPYSVTAGTDVYDTSNGTGTALSATTYAGNGPLASSPRIILQSPHATGWQVRISNEPSSWVVYTSVGTRWSIAPGFNGNSLGDFPAHSPSLNGGLFFNNNPNDTSYAYAGTTVGPGSGSGAGGASYSAGQRITCTGDDTGQAVCIIIRSSSTNTSGYQYSCFGIPDNEPSPLPPTNMQRLFVIAKQDNAYGSGYGLSFLWSVGNNSTIPGITGLGFGLDNSICSCSPSCWSATAITSSGQGVSPMFSANAGDSPFLGATELLPVDLINGVFFSSGTYGGNTIKVMNEQTRTIGTMPFLRAGRANFGNFSTTTDANNSWYHFVNGVYLQWGGPPVIP